MNSDNEDTTITSDMVTMSLQLIVDLSGALVSCIHMWQSKRYSHSNRDIKCTRSAGINFRTDDAK